MQTFVHGADYQAPGPPARCVFVPS